LEVKYFVIHIHEPTLQRKCTRGELDL